MLRQKREGPMAKRYIVTLSEEERADLLALTKRGQIAARKLIRAHVLMQLEVVKLSEAEKGFVLLPKRWVVERSVGWTGRFRRLARDYE
jgi:transposase